VHHPFTAPAASHVDTFAQDPADVPARAYDLILNGTELGGGSIRIHSSEVQKRVFDVIGLTPEQASEQFGFLLEAFSFGPPPHGGIAFGIDRIAAMVTGSESIREVIAFPKTGGGGDPLTGAPYADHRPAARRGRDRRRPGGLTLRRLGSARERPCSRPS
jgi:aspartyl-tRNA synthetase